MSGIRPGLRPGRGSVRWALVRSTAWSPSTGFRPRWCPFATGVLVICWPAGSAWTRSTVTRAIGEVRPLLAERDAWSAPTCGCERWPRSLTIWDGPGRPASSTAPRSGSAARPSAARTGTGSSPVASYRHPTEPSSLARLIVGVLRHDRTHERDHYSSAPSFSRVERVRRIRRHAGARRGLGLLGHRLLRRYQDHRPLHRGQLAAGSGRMGGPSARSGQLDGTHRPAGRTCPARGRPRDQAGTP